MDRTIPTWHSRVVVVAILVAIISVVGVGVGAVAGETNTTQIPDINQNNSLSNIYSGEDSHKIENINVQYSLEPDKHNVTNMYVGLSELQDSNINTTSAVISDIKVENGSVSNISKIESNNQTIFKIRIKHKNNQQGFNITSLEFEGLNTSTVQMASDVSYQLIAVSNESGIVYQDLIEQEDLVKSTSFKIADGSFTLSDQATGSTQISSESRTSLSITVENITTNIDSELIIVEDHNGTTFYDSKSIPLGPISNGSNISQEVSFLRGNISAYLIPSEHVNIDQYDRGDEIPISVIKSATAKENGQLVLGSVEFENQEFNTAISSNITIFHSEIQDADGEKTPYIVSIHPVTSEDEILYETSYGYSDVLEGSNENKTINIKNADGENTTIWHSNQFAAVLRLAKNYSVGETPHLPSTEVLPNSDIDDQFVTGGVSNKGNIIISENHTSDIQDSVDVDYDFVNQSGSIERVYAGRTLNIKSNTTDSGNVEIHKISEENQSKVVGIGNRVNDSRNFIINTKKYQTGKYRIFEENSGISDTFEIVSKSDQYSRIKSNREEYTSGSLVHSKLQHETPSVQLTITNSYNNSTAATINLSTPQKGNTGVEFNTYTAANGSLADAIVTADDTVTVDSVETETPNETLSPGTYELAVQSEHGDASTENATTFTLRSRSTNGITSYATDKMDPTDLKTADAIRSAVTDGTLSPTSTVGPDQTVVYAVNASGLTGLPAAENATLDTGSDLREFSGFSFGVQPTASTELSTADGTDALGEVPDDSTVHIDESRLYVATNGTDAFGADDPPSDGEEFTATFRVDDDNLRATATDPPDDHSVTTTLSYADPDNGPSDGDDGTRAVGDGGSATGGSPTGGSSAGAGGGSTGGGSAGSGPPSDGVESNTGPSAADPAGPSDDGVVPPRGSDATYAEYGAGIRHVTSQQTPHPTVPAAIRFSSTANDAPADSDRSATPANTAQDQPRDGTDDRDEIREPDAPRYDDAPIRSTAYDVPGFGPVVTLTSLVTAVFFATRRQ